MLGVADRLELEQQLAEQPAGELARVGLDLDDREAVDRVHERHPARAPLEGRRAQRARLGPAPELEQRVGGVAAQEVAVHRLEARPPRRLDALVRDVDRLLAPADEVEDRREVGVDPEQLVVVAHLLGQAERLAQERDACLGVLAPAERHAERRRRVDHLAVGLGARTAVATAIASRASDSASENVPSSIRTWASAASTVARSTDGSDGTSDTARRRAVSAPSRSPTDRRYRPSRSWSRSRARRRSLRSSSDAMTVST